MGKLYIHINKDYFDKSKDLANKASKELDCKDYLYDIDFKLDELNLEGGKLFVCGETDLGYVSLDFEMDTETVIDIIEFYMKKLGKLKTILEATK